MKSFKVGDYIVGSVIETDELQKKANLSLIPQDLNQNLNMETIFENLVHISPIMSRFYLQKSALLKNIIFY